MISEENKEMMEVMIQNMEKMIETPNDEFQDTIDGGWWEFNKIFSGVLYDMNDRFCDWAKNAGMKVHIGVVE